VSVCPSVCCLWHRVGHQDVCVIYVQFGIGAILQKLIKKVRGSWKWTSDIFYHSCAYLFTDVCVCVCEIRYKRSPNNAVEQIGVHINQYSEDHILVRDVCEIVPVFYKSLFIFTCLKLYEQNIISNPKYNIWLGRPMHRNEEEVKKSSGGISYCGMLSSVDW
jgi:hypothetical protein